MTHLVTSPGTNTSHRVTSPETNITHLVASRGTSSRVRRVVDASLVGLKRHWGRPWPLRFHPAHPYWGADTPCHGAGMSLYSMPGRWSCVRRCCSLDRWSAAGCKTNGGSESESWGEGDKLKTKLLKCWVIVQMNIHAGMIDKYATTKIKRESLEFMFCTRNYTCHGDNDTDIGCQYVICQSRMSDLYASFFWAATLRFCDFRFQLKKKSFYIAQYPVRWTAQSALHFFAFLDRPVHSDTNSASPGSILAIPHDLVCFMI